MTVEWVTPKPFIHLARQVMGGIDLDPASSDFAQRNVEAGTYYTPELDGLRLPWFGRVWLSPPNGRGGAAAFTGRLIEEFCAGRVSEAIVLVPNSSDTAWFHRMTGMRMPFCVKTGRISFVSPDRKTSTPPNGQVFFYFGDDPRRFRDAFRPLGICSVTVSDCAQDAERCAIDRAKASANRPQWRALTNSKAA